MLLRLAYLGITNAFTMLRLLPAGDPAAPAAADPATRSSSDTGPDRAPPRRSVAAPAARPAPHAALDPGLGATPGEGEQQLGVSQGAWRTAHARDQGRPVHREILREDRIAPAPDRAATTWTDFLRSQAHALPAVDFLETVTLTGTRMYILTVIEHTSRRIRVLSVTAHPTATCVAQAARNLVMDPEDANCQIKYLIRARDGKYAGIRRDSGRRRHQGRAHRYPGAP